MTNDELLQKMIAGDLSDEEQALLDERSAADASFSAEIEQLHTLQTAMSEDATLSEEEEKVLSRTHSAVVALMSTGAIGTGISVVADKAVSSGASSFIQGLSLSIGQWTAAALGTLTIVGLGVWAVLSPTTTSEPSSGDSSPEVVALVDSHEVAEEEPLAPEVSPPDEPVSEEPTTVPSEAGTQPIKNSDSPSPSAISSTPPAEALTELPSPDRKLLLTSLSRFQERYEIYVENGNTVGQANTLREIVRLHSTLGQQEEYKKTVPVLVSLLNTLEDKEVQARGWLAIARSAVAMGSSASDIQVYLKNAEDTYNSTELPKDIKDEIDKLKTTRR